MPHIVCFGNPLHGDDGFGAAVYTRLNETPLPDGWRAFDAGTSGLNALWLFRDCGEAIIVDSLAPGAEPGRLRELTAGDVLTEAAPVGHGGGVGYLLQALQAMPEPPPRVRIVAVESADVSAFRPGLSAPVAAAVAPAVALIRSYIGAGDD
ncbi:hydrogenase maturation protease [Methylomonas sp. LWB]|uniref:hydrogenase maturation protease n=1 Tax=Methylomonas sp. LWB TaxID=1905845 RepID=UPI0008DAAD38|nr:hydrogenase maturation protease [Methylomonas sp. LWB]OHX36223.1 hydrogenase maturation protease [Methylomonas sp. LWB]